MNLNLNQSRRETPRCVGAGAGLLLYVNVCEWFTVTTLKGAHCTHDRRTAHAAGQALHPLSEVTNILYPLALVILPLVLIG